MNFVSRAWAALFGVALLTGCGGQPIKVASPPEIIRVPQYLPLPVDCATHHPMNLPAGSAAADVMLEQREVIDAYRDQVERCFKGAAGGA